MNEDESVQNLTVELPDFLNNPDRLSARLTAVDTLRKIDQASPEQAIYIAKQFFIQKLLADEVCKGFARRSLGLD